MTPRPSGEIDLPLSFEPYRERLEATVKPYIQIQTHITQTATLWQSKFLGLPYLPQSISLPKTPDGNYLYLLAQINFAEVPHLSGFPSQGILQFYLAKADLYGADFDNPTAQTGFQVVYHPEPELDESKLVTVFGFMPSPWDDDGHDMPFEVYSKYRDRRDSCLALTFHPKTAPISICDYRYAALVGFDPLTQGPQDERGITEDESWPMLNDYSSQFDGDRLGGYPLFTEVAVKPTSFKGGIQGGE